MKDQKSEKIIEQHLASLSKDELKDLVMQFAPKQFWVAVKNKYSDKSDAQKTFENVRYNIESLFEDDDILHEKEDFDIALDKEIFKLSGLEHLLKNEIGELLLYIISKVNDALDAGYLYDQYEDEVYEASEEFVDYVAGFLTDLNFEEKTSFLSNLYARLTEQSYDTFDSLYDVCENAYSESEFPEVKEMLLHSFKSLSPVFTQSCYERVRHLLNAAEKELILIEIQNRNSKWVLELAKLFDLQGKSAKAVQALEGWLMVNRNGMDENVYTLFLDMSAKANLNMVDAAKFAITECPRCSVMQKISTLISNKSLLSEYEIILEKKSDSQFLKYLDTENRISEAVAYIKRSKNIWHGDILNFYKKHKLTIPADAEEFFCKEINKNLEFTGDSYYETIAEILKELRQINSTLTDGYLSKIRTEYKRRRNLIAILAKL